MEGEHAPLGKPVPVDDATSWLALFGSIGTTVVAAGGTVLLLLSSSLGRTRGASRSAQLEWQQRQQEIERVVTPPAPPADRS